MINQQFRLMQQVLTKVIQSLLAQQITPFLSGSFALCVYAGKLIGEPQDIDFLFRSRTEHDRAVTWLESELEFKRVHQQTWESDTADESVNTKLVSPEGIGFDLACTIGDIALSFDPKHTIQLNECAVPVLSLEDLQKSYQRYADEKPGTEAKLKIITELL